MKTLKKKFISIMLIFVLLMAVFMQLVPTKVFAVPKTDKYIRESKATMSSMTLTPGTTPNDYTITSSEPSKYTISQVRWYDRTDGGNLIDNTATLISGHEYRVQFNFAAVNGYEYGTSVYTSSDFLLNDILTYTTLANDGSTLRYVDFPCGSALSTHSLTFSLNGGTWTITNPRKVSHGKRAYTSFVKPTKANYVFDGWYADSGLTTPFDYNSVINDDTTLYAKWALGYKVTFNVNGGTWDYSSPNPQEVKDGGTGGIAYKPKNPTKDGHIFGGWYVDSGLTTPFDFSKKITEDKTLYAKWNSTTIKSLNAIVTPTPVTGLTLGDLTVTSEDSSRYTIVPSSIGWKLNDSGSILADTTPIEAGQTYTLYLSFTPESGYTLSDSATYTVNGNDTSWTGFEAIENRKISFVIPPAETTKTITIRSYSTTTDEYDVGGTISLTTDHGTDGLQTIGYSKVATENTAVQLNAVAGDGYEFLGWRKNGLVSATQIKTLSHEFTATDDVIWYAIFRKTNTITFNPNGGGGTMDSVTVGGTYKLPTTTTFTAPEGMQFKGWSLTIDGDIITEIYMNENKSVYAVWEDKAILHTHSYTTITTKATTSKNGSIVEKCSCGDVKSAIDFPKVSTVKLSKTSFKYNKKVQKPTVTIKDCKGKALKEGTDYTIKYSNKNSKKVGEYTVTITFKGNYEGSKELTYQIKPKEVSLKKLTKGKKQFKATWGKNTTETTGYQVQYSTKKDFSSGNKIATIKKNKTTGTTIKKLKNNKKYYVRIRTYKTVKDKKIYSGWSKVLTVKTK